MRISITEAEGQLTELAELARTGINVVLTQDEKPAMQLVPLSRSPLSAEERRKVFKDIRQKAQEQQPTFDTDAARSQDFLYDENGLPI
jgi:antitoxin (DNA-binding transcriptional repressor) of toxin-antitoxin stability system